MNERRGMRRWHTLHPAIVLVEGAQKSARCNITDVSLKGMQLCLPFPLRKDEFVTINVELSFDCAFKAQVWVAWEKRVGYTHVHGLYFTTIDESSREAIYRFMRMQFPQQLQCRHDDHPSNKGAEPAEDNRVFARFPVAMGGKLLDLKNNREVPAETLDISAKGVGVMTNCALEVKTPLELWLNVPDKGEPLYSRGEVVWSVKSGADEYRAGINLERADLMGLSRVMRA
ncbi:MAG TPA: PilZ domain-containing protein [Candidatus Omnitrophota bacterium]|nr:PilZ domain-containing protein [Candidatus Omnitrophota bacterium]HPT07999.1 PilZ domain-containing protein [Candidatus Omnitrophota bacterium]